MFYTKLTDEEVTSTYTLFNLLCKLRVIGQIHVHAEEVERGSSDVFGNYLMYHFPEGGYSLIKDGYSSQPRIPDALEQIESILNREFKKLNPRR
jgi:hypothetical protein